MAAWQFQFALVPKAGILKVHGHLPETLPEYGMHIPEEQVKDSSEFNNYWENAEPSSFPMKALKSVLLPQESWSNDAKMFGSANGNSIEIWSDDIFCAIDVRNLDISLLRSILEIANNMQCKVALKDRGRLIDPDLATVLTEIRNSPAKKFVENPIDFIKNRQE